MADFLPGDIVVIRFGLDHASFIRLEEIILAPASLIMKSIGKYPNIEKLIEVHKIEMI